MAVELATGYVSLTVSARGISQQIARELAPVEGLASAAGAKAGSALGTNVAAGLATRLKSSGSKIAEAGSSLTLGLSAPIAGIGFLAFKAASDFETAFAGVKKTVDGTAPQIERLRQGIIDMANEIPASREEIAAVAEAAGQLGVSTPAILDFTRTMIDLGNTTDLSADQAASAIARLANITGLPQDQFDNLGATIVDLGNKSAATESEITEMALRIAGAGTQVGLSEANILSFGAALSSVGIEAEAGGSAISRVFVSLDQAVKEGGTQLATFAQVAGQSSADFRKSFETDAAGASVAFITGLKRISDEGGNVFAVLDQLGLSDIRVRDALLRASGAGDLFAETLKTGNRAFKENTALTTEAGKRYETTASQLEVAKNQATDVARQFGEALAPAVISAAQSAGPLVDALGVMVDAFRALPAPVQTGVVAIGALAAAAGPVAFIAGNIMKGVSGLATGFSAVVSGSSKAAQAVGRFADGFKSAQAAQSAFSGKLGTLGGNVRKAGTALASGVKAAAGFADTAVRVAIGIGQQTAAFVAQKAAMLAAAVATKAAAAAQVLLNIAMTANPIGLIVVGVAALVAAFILAYKNIDIFRESVDAVVRFIIDNWPLALAVLTGGMSLVAKVVIDNWDTIKKAVETAITFVSNVITTVVGAVVAFWQTQWAIFTAVPRAALAAVVSAVSAGINLIRSTITAWFGAVRAAWDAFWRALVDVVDVLREIPAKITRFFAGARTLLFDIGSDIINGLIDGIEAVWGEVEDTIADLASHLPGVVKDILGISSPAKAFIPIGEAIPQGIAVGIKNSDVAVTKALNDIYRNVQLQTAKLRLADLFPGADEAADFSDFNPKLNLNPVIKQFAQAASQIAQPFFDVLPEINDVLDTVGEDVDLSGLVDGLVGQATVVQDWLGSLGTAVEQGKPALAAKVAELGTEQGSALAKAYAEASPEVQAQFDLLLAGQQLALIEAKQKMLEFIPAFAESGVAMSSQLSKGFADSLTIGEISLAEVGAAAVTVSTDERIPQAGLVKGGEVTQRFKDALKFVEVSDTAVNDAANLVRLNATLPEGSRILSGSATVQYLQALLLAGATQQQIAEAAKVFDSTGDIEIRARTAGNRAGTAYGEGMATGIFGQKFKVQTALEDLIFSATTHGSVVLQENSPSKLTRDRLGKPFGEGIAVGVAGTSSGLNRAVGSTIDSAVSAASNLIDRAQITGTPRIALRVPDISTGLVAALRTAAQNVRSALAGIRRQITEWAAEVETTTLRLKPPTVPDLDARIAAHWDLDVPPTVPVLDATVVAEWANLPDPPPVTIETGFDVAALVLPEPSLTVPTDFDLARLDLPAPPQLEVPVVFERFTVPALPELAVPVGYDVAPVPQLPSLAAAVNVRWRVADAPTIDALTTRIDAEWVIDAAPRVPAISAPILARWALLPDAPLAPTLDSTIVATWTLTAPPVPPGLLSTVSAAWDLEAPPNVPALDTLIVADWTIPPSPEIPELLATVGFVIPELVLPTPEPVTGLVEFVTGQVEDLPTPAPIVVPVGFSVPPIELPTVEGVAVPVTFLPPIAPEVPDLAATVATAWSVPDAPVLPVLEAQIAAAWVLDVVPILPTISTEITAGWSVSTPPAVPSLSAQVEADWFIAELPDVPTLHTLIEAEWHVPELSALNATPFEVPAAIAPTPVTAPAPVEQPEPAQTTTVDFAMQVSFQQPPADEDVRNVEKAARRGLAAAMRAEG